MRAKPGYISIKEEDGEKRQPKASRHTRKKKGGKEEAERGSSKYLGEVYSDLTAPQAEADQVDSRQSRPHSRRSSSSRRRSRSRDSRRSERRERGRSERRSQRSSRRESHVR